jgi:hypothetical protein
MTGKLFLALVTVGTWSEANTTLAQLAAKVTPLDTHVDVSPEAIHQRMHKKAMAFLQDMIRQALATVPSMERGCDDGLFTHFTNVYIADSTGFERPEALHKTFPGSGGSAAQAGANIQAVWDYPSSGLGHFALTPWNIPDQKYLDKVVAVAQQGLRCIFDGGSFQLTAFSRLAPEGAYFFSRLHHQTTLWTMAAGRWQPVELARWLTTAAGQLLERPMFLGAKARVASRLMASRVPEAIVNEPRRKAKQKAKKKGDPPSQAHLTLMAWNLLMTNGPHTLWKTATVVNV